MLEFHYKPAEALAARPYDVLKISVHADDGPTQTFTFPADASQTITLSQSAAEGHGLHIVETTLWRNGAPLWTYSSGFWIRDWDYLRDGPKLTVGTDYFALDGKPLPVVGTTYMASDVNRLYLAEPNAFVWDQDMKQIHAAGLNMIRSGIWSGWDLLVNPDKTVSEDPLRVVEAFLMTARRYNLPVQFNLFAFVPDAFGGREPYLNPAARQLQDRYVFSLVHRFHDVPFLAWDLINEPSANENAWKTLPEHEPFEEAEWRQWLKQRYPDRAAFLLAWAEPSFGVGRALQSAPTDVPPEVAAADPFAMPAAGAFEPDGVRSGYNPLKVYDYFLFSESMFGDWVRHQRETIHAAGSDQLVTVGQDEGGVSPCAAERHGRRCSDCSSSIDLDDSRTRSRSASDLSRSRPAGPHRHDAVLRRRFDQGDRPWRGQDHLGRRPRGVFRGVRNDSRPVRLCQERCWRYCSFQAATASFPGRSRFSHHAQECDPLQLLL